MHPSGEATPELRRAVSSDTLRTAMYWVVVIAGTWWILDQLASVLRPLLLAVFLGYVLMPYYTRFRRKVPAAMALGLLAGLAAGGLVIFALLLSASLFDLNDELPQLKTKAVSLIERGVGYFDRQAAAIGMAPPVESTEPTTTGPATPRTKRETELAELVLGGVRSAANSAAGGVLEAATAALYLLFLLLGAEHLPTRVREAYPEAQAEQILDVAGRINAAIISYLKAKVKSSLLLAIPVGIILTVFGVKFAFLWTVLTFFCNFIPYLGTVIAYTLPVGFSFLQLDLDYRPVTVATLLLACHALAASLLEPMLIGRAVGLSPLVILATLSMWGLLWGLPGMFLAVPLTVVLKIVFENIEVTRPMAKMLGG